MRIYFTSCEPCALRLGGVYAGFCAAHEQFAEFSPSDRVIAEFFPENAELSPLSFLADEKFFSSPPDFADVYDFGCGALIHIKHFYPRVRGIRLLTQMREGGFLVTLYKDAFLQVAAEGNGSFFTRALPYSVRSAKLFPLRAGKTTLLAVQEETDKKESFLMLTNGAELLFEGRVLSVTGGEYIETEQAFYDLAGHVAKSSWEAGAEGLRLVRYDVRAREGFSPSAINENLLPFAFFQAVRARADFKAYLSDELIARADKLLRYLGNFSGVLIPPSVFYLKYGKINAVGLLFAEKQNLFRVRFFETPVKDGKIVNIIPVGEDARAT